MMVHSTSEKLIVAAARLFRRKGYSATAITDILDEAGVPRGSLYHHFPGGKHDLAISAAKWSSLQILDLIDEAFDEARRKDQTFLDAVVGICERLAAIFEAESQWDYGPIASTLLDGVANEAFQTTAYSIFRSWQNSFIGHAESFGTKKEEAMVIGDKLFMMLEGAWVLSRAFGNASPIRQVAKLICYCVDHK